MGLETFYLSLSRLINVTRHFNIRFWGQKVSRSTAAIWESMRGVLRGTSSWNVGLPHAYSVYKLLFKIVNVIPT